MIASRKEVNPAFCSGHLSWIDQYERMVLMIIDQEFRNLIPRLAVDEYEQLEKNIVAEGCRDALVVWAQPIMYDTGYCRDCCEDVAVEFGPGGNWECPKCGYGIYPMEEIHILIDGHNRYDICQDHGIEFKTIEMDFDSRDEVIDWIINNQLGRRNLTPANQSYLRGLQYEREKKKIPNEQGINQFSEVEGKNCTQPKTAERLAEQHNVSPRTIKNDAEFTRAVDTITQNTTPQVKQQILNHEIPVTKKDTLELAKAEPEVQRQVIQEVATGESKTVKEAIEKKTPHVAYNSGNNEWYTPSPYIEAAKEVMGDIDLDPASSEVANRVVGAKQIFTIEDNGLEQDWTGRVWMNPPYAGELIPLFCDKLVNYFATGDIQEAIVLVNNATETAWFNTLIGQASAIVFPKGRVKFYTPGGSIGAPLQGQAVIYFGENPHKFLSCFKQFGWGTILSE